MDSGLLPRSGRSTRSDASHPVKKSALPLPVKKPRISIDGGQLPDLGKPDLPTTESSISRNPDDTGSPPKPAASFDGAGLSTAAPPNPVIDAGLDSNPPPTICEDARKLYDDQIEKVRSLDLGFRYRICRAVEFAVTQEAIVANVPRIDLKDLYRLISECAVRELPLDEAIFYIVKSVDLELGQSE